MASTTLNYELEFTDGTTYRISVGPLPPSSSAVSNFKSKIISSKNLPNPAPVWYDYIVNKDGAKLRTDTYITKAWIETTEETEIL